MSHCISIAISTKYSIVCGSFVHVRFSLPSRQSGTLANIYWSFWKHTELSHVSSYCTEKAWKTLARRLSNSFLFFNFNILYFFCHMTYGISGSQIRDWTWALQWKCWSLTLESPENSIFVFGNTTKCSFSSYMYLGALHLVLVSETQAEEMCHF